MQINHGEITTKNLISHIAIFQNTTKAFYHKHSVGHFVSTFQHIDFIHGRRSKFHSHLLKFQISSPSSVQQHIHSSDMRMDTKTDKRSIYIPKCNIIISPIVCLRLQMENTNLIQELFDPIRRFDIITQNRFQGFPYQLRNRSEILTRKTLLGALP